MSYTRKLLLSFTKGGHKLWFNKYFLSFLIFAIYLCFFDQYNMFAQIKLSSSVQELKVEKQRYEQQLVNALKEKEMLKKDAERYAREHYFMHKENEDVYIIEEVN